VFVEYIETARISKLDFPATSKAPAMGEGGGLGCWTLKWSVGMK